MQDALMLLHSVVGAAFNNFKFFSPSADCAVSKTDAFTLEYFESFQTATMDAAISVRHLRFCIR